MSHFYNLIHSWVNSIIPVLISAEIIFILIACKIDKVRFRGYGFIFCGVICFFLYVSFSLLASFGLFVIQVSIDNTSGFQLHPIVYLVKEHLYSLGWLSFGVGAYLWYVDSRKD